MQIHAGRNVAELIYYKEIVYGFFLSSLHSYMFLITVKELHKPMEIVILL